MLNPVDADAVIREGGLVGRFPGEIHEGVAWWLGACLVVTCKAGRIAVAHNGHPAVIRFADRFCLGAINAQHYRCKVRYLGCEQVECLLLTLQHLGGVSGAYLAADDDESSLIRITLYNEKGVALNDTNGLEQIRRLISEDRVPIPVNAQARGTIESGQEDLTPGGQA